MKLQVFRLLVSMKDKNLATAIILICIIAGISGLWFIDIGASGEILNAQGFNITAEGFIFIRKPSQQYHLGITLNLSSLAILSFLCFYILNSNE